MVDAISFIVGFASYYGIFVILAISLNLEYGYAGQPNFGQVLFYGLGAFVGAIVAANLLPYLVHIPIGNICSAGGYLARTSIGMTNAGVSLGVWIIALILAMIAGGIVGLAVSYPAIRVKEEWYLSMILLVAGEAFVIIINNTQQIGCGFQGLDGILNPFTWVANLYINSSFASTNVGIDLPSAIYASAIMAFAAICYFVAQRLVNSPYGRLLKSIRDDKVAAESLGKDVAAVRRRIMVIGSIMAGLAGGLYVYYLGAAGTDDFVPAVTFTIWVMMILGGYANNRGILAGAFVLTFLEQGATLLSVIIQPYLPSGVSPSVVIYLEYALEAVILILLLLFRPKGLIPETRIQTKAYELFDFSKSQDQKAADSKAEIPDATVEKEQKET